MDRITIYPGAIPLETDLLSTNKNTMIALGKLSAALLGGGTMVSGFAVTPTGPASLQVIAAPGEIYSLQNVDSAAYSSLPADTAHQIVKQGVLLDSTTLNCPSPTTSGQSINYLVEVAYQDLDSNPVVLPYYNASNPSQAYSGPNNTGVAQNTARKGIAIIQAKAGASAATGSQTTPAPDAGYVGLYVVTVAFGQTTITSANVSIATGAPFINATLHGLTPVFTAPPVVPPATQSQHAMQFGQTVLSARKSDYTASGSFTVPPGVTAIYVSGAAGGGGGAGGGPGNTSNGAGGGGGGGAGQPVIRQKYTVTPGQVITVSVGNGGVGGPPGTNGSPGGGTALSGVVSLSGGGGGTYGSFSATTSGGGFGGTGFPGGGVGASVTSGAGSGVGGAGASGPFGGGGAGGFGGLSASLPAFVGSSGYGYGSGGGGGGGGGFYASNSGAAGAAGQSGFVTIEW